ncbi:hypothetical protein [Streptomyces hebeiensis]
MPNTTAQILAAAARPAAQLRTGEVTDATPNSVAVNVGGTTITAGFDKRNPVRTGELVALLEQGGTWLVLYALAGAASNEIINPSFNDGLDHWTAYDVTGSTTWTPVGPGPGGPDGDWYVTALTEDAAAESYLYSDPIGVTAGDVYSVSAYVWGSYAGDAAQDADASLLALWFANATDLYPTTSSANITIASLLDVPSPPPFSTLSGTVTAPVTGYMRIALRSVISTTGSLGWDLIVAREVN